MESPLRRRLAFAAIVCALVGLGAYLIGPVAHHSRPPARPAAANTPHPSALPSTAPVPATSAQLPDIYQWLPFTQSGLAAAASIAVRFGDAYGTYSYTQTPAAYAATLRSLCSSALAQQVEAAYSVPGVTSARDSSKQVAVGAATVESIAAFGPTSITFTVQITQKTTATSGSSQQDTDYTLTLTGNGTSWQVTSVELASVGNS